MSSRFLFAWLLVVAIMAATTLAVPWPAPVLEGDQPSSGFMIRPRRATDEEKKKELEEFVKEKLAEYKKKAPEGHSVLVFNTDENYKKELYDIHSFDQFEEHDKKWGAWTFKCGEFENKAKELGKHIWAWEGDSVELDKDGDEVEFYHKDCPKKEYREKDD